MAGIYIEKKTKYLPYITGVGAIINIGGNFLLIPSFGMYGAAAATFLSYFAMMAYIYYISQKFYPVKYELNRVVLLNIVNVAAIVFFYLFFYQVIPAYLILKLVILVLLVLLAVYISGLTKAKVLFQKAAVKPAGESKTGIQDEYIP
jgi:O-antigen/teichoic acid export membrane protein